VWVSLPEIYRIAEFLEMDDHEFSKRYVRKVHQKFSLIEKPNGDCIFYDHGCTIYPVRPTQCSTFPFWPEIIRTPAAWKTASTDCPGMNHGQTFSENEIEDLSKSNHS
jgi:Fe-S-cluster containining protein